jgi:hypothetical protein
VNAPRWIRALARQQAVLLPLAGRNGGFGVFPRADRRRRPLARASAVQVEAAEAKGWLCRRGEGRGLSADGLLAARSRSSDPAERHRKMVERPVMLDTGLIVTANANAREGALGKWADMLDPAERNAGERFLADYHRSTLMQPVTRNWAPTAPRRGEGRPSGREDAALSAIAAKDRVMKVLDALGPGLARIVEAVLIREESLAAMERRFGWAQRSGRTVVKLALGRLAEIYGML